MQIDWFTFAAQVFNFLVLVVALKFLLYDRVTAAMRERSDSIRDRFDEADRARDDAEDLKAEYERRREDLDRRRHEILDRAREEARERRRELLEEARREVDERRERWLESLGEEREDFLRRMRIGAAGEIYRIARGAIGDLAGADLDGRVVDRFIERLRGIDDERRERLRETAGGDGSMSVRTPFELSRDLRDRLETALREEIGGAEVSFEREPGLLLGVELFCDGLKLSWSAGPRLDRLEERVTGILERAGGEAERDDDGETEREEQRDA